MQKENIKALIELSTSFEIADEVMSKYTDCQSEEDRIAFLMDMFNCRIIGNHEKDTHSDYVALLTSIVGQKWRRGSATN